MTFAIRLMKYEDLWRIVECSEHGGIHSSPQLEMPRWPWQGSFKRVRATRPPQKNYIHKLPINRKAAGARHAPKRQCEGPVRMSHAFSRGGP